MRLNCDQEHRFIAVDGYALPFTDDFPPMPSVEGLPGVTTIHWTGVDGTMGGPDANTGVHLLVPFRDRDHAMNVVLPLAKAYFEKKVAIEKANVERHGREIAEIEKRLAGAREAQAAHAVEAGNAAAQLALVTQQLAELPPPPPPAPEKPPQDFAAAAQPVAGA